MGTELSRRDGKGVLEDLFSKITRLDLGGEKRKPLRDGQVDVELMVVWKILWTDLKWNAAFLHAKWWFYDENSSTVLPYMTTLKILPLGYIWPLLPIKKEHLASLSDWALFGTSTLGIYDNSVLRYADDISPLFKPQRDIIITWEGEGIFTCATVVHGEEFSSFQTSTSIVWDMTDNICSRQTPSDFGTTRCQ